MKDYVKRMIEEHKQLKERIGKLKKFLESDVEINEEKESLMLAQYHAMKTYDFILTNRLALECDDGNCTAEDVNDN